MSEYIKRENVMQAIQEIYEREDADRVGFGEEQIGVLVGLDYAKETIKEIPHADVVEVVRCKDCIWYDLNNHECTGEVNSMDEEGGAQYSLEFYDDDYCSFGQKR